MNTAELLEKLKPGCKVRSWKNHARYIVRDDYIIKFFGDPVFSIDTYFDEEDLIICEMVGSCFDVCPKNFDKIEMWKLEKVL